MKESWRWFGPNDPISIQEIMQTGAKAVVTALHHIPNGEVWPEAEIIKRKNEVEYDSQHNVDSGLCWEVVESVPVHEAIKQGLADRDTYIANYQQSLRHLAQHGIHTVIYNFMPILDWTRTDLSFPLATGERALLFDEIALAAFDQFILQRPQAITDYSTDVLEQAENYYAKLSSVQKEKLTRTIIAGLPGAEEHFTIDQFKTALSAYDQINSDKLRQHLCYFLQRVCPVAEEVGIKLAIHPDDPPFQLFGLPRIISTIEDYQWLFNAIPSPANGMTLCAGSLGSRADNDLVAFVKQLGARIYFTHLRNVQLNSNNRSFYEAAHLSGSTNMYQLVHALIGEEHRRHQQGIASDDIPMRPDHGHQMLDDLNKTSNPGYSCIGRMKGLAEMRGLIYAVESEMSDA